jgi:hypothetical protein
MFEENLLPNGALLPNSAHRSVSFLYQFLVLTHGHDSKHEASSGRTNNARKGVDESIWAVQLVEHAGNEVMEEK